MMEMNICASTRTTRAFAKAHSLPFTQPPAPALTGVWFRADGQRAYRITEKADDDILVYDFASRASTTCAYTNELNTQIRSADGALVFDLADGGYQLVSAAGTFNRKDDDILVFVDPSVLEGVIPKLERTLKADRKAAKAKLAAAEAEDDKAAAAFYDNFQNAVKVIMNALYGGLGSGKGGIFPDGAPLASAITARGRSLIVLVKSTIESRFALMPSGDMVDAGTTGSTPLRILYGGRRMIA